MAYQSLYRRYRSRTFGELVGQRHVVTALKNAIAEDRVGHAYLFSGPRGTGKTSTARILGKALNCTNLGSDGEPCCECDSCLAFEAGASYDLQELDAASNNGVEAVRDLISKVALGSPGRTKVYILDEVHMLTAGAENALLKTLEEPPDHVVFVLATTEPHKVVPTIRSRTQHFEFELIAADELEAHVRWVADDAGLDIDDAMVDFVLRAGGGSARDTLSALDQVVAAGGVPRDDDAIDGVMAALAAADPGRVVLAVSEALKAGRDPRVIGETVLARLRDAFLASMRSSLAHLSDAQRASATATATEMGPAAITRGLEVLGVALIDMRQAPDPRVDLEVALLRLTRPDLDTDLAAVVARLERLEQGALPARGAPDVASQPAAEPAAEPDSTATPSAPVDPQPAPAPTAQRGRPADGARAALASTRSDVPAAAEGRAEIPNGPDSSGPSDPEPAARSAQGQPTLGATRAGATAETPPSTSDAGDEPADRPPVGGAPVDADSSGPMTQEAVAPTVDASAAPATGAPALADLLRAWDEIKAGLPGRAKSRFSGGRFVDVTTDAVVFGLPNAIHRDRCKECASDVEQALSSHFGQPVLLNLVIDDAAVAPAVRAAPEPAPPAASEPAGDDDVIDLDGLTDASPDAAGGVELLTEAFPGAELVDPPDNG